MAETPETKDREIINEYDKTPQQIATDKIIAIKQKARDDIAEVKHKLMLELLADNSKAIDKACKKENRRRYREAKRIEYLNRKKRYSTGEEIFNSITHGIGTGLAIAATVLLIIKAALFSTPEMKPFYVTGFAVFGGSMILLYLMSTLYHALTPIGAKKIFAIFDHVSIYVLIAGTYTPFCLGSLHNVTGWVLFGIIWALAIIGVVFYSVFGSRIRFVSTVTYILMGWLIVVAIRPIKAVLPPISLLFLILGGIVYTVGVLFYVMKSKKWMHSIWHLFVMGGSIFMFFAVFFSL